jgi:hypothetical protein
MQEEGEGEQAHQSCGDHHRPQAPSQIGLVTIHGPKGYSYRQRHPEQRYYNMRKHIGIVRRRRLSVCRLLVVAWLKRR